MGFWDKLFGKKGEGSEPGNSSHKTDELMDEDTFWGMVEDTMEFKNDPEEQAYFLEGALESLTPREIIGFALRMQKLMRQSYKSSLWCAVYVLRGGCGDDGFDYFRYWLISQGRSAFEKVILEHDSLIQVLQGSHEIDFDGESFGNSAARAFTNKTGRSMNDYIDWKVLQNEIGLPKEIQFDWTEGDPESMRKICPRLFEKYWGKWDE